MRLRFDEDETKSGPSYVVEAVDDSGAFCLTENRSTKALALRDVLEMVLKLAADNGFINAMERTFLEAKIRQLSAKK